MFGGPIWTDNPDRVSGEVFCTCVGVVGKTLVV